MSSIRDFVRASSISSAKVRASSARFRKYSASLKSDDNGTTISRCSRRRSINSEKLSELPVSFVTICDRCHGTSSHLPLRLLTRKRGNGRKHPSTAFRGTATRRGKRILCRPTGGVQRGLGKH